jgi:hypothetical protein
MYNDSIRTSQETHYVSITRTATVHFVPHRKHITSPLQNQPQFISYFAGNTLRLQYKNNYSAFRTPQETHYRNTTKTALHFVPQRKHITSPLQSQPHYIWYLKETHYVTTTNRTTLRSVVQSASYAGGFFPTWKWEWHVPPKRRYWEYPYGVTFKKTAFFVVAAVETSNPTRVCWCAWWEQIQGKVEECLRGLRGAMMDWSWESLRILPIMHKYLVRAWKGRTDLLRLLQSQSRAFGDVFLPQIKYSVMLCLFNYRRLGFNVFYTYIQMLYKALEDTGRKERDSPTDWYLSFLLGYSPGS